MMPQASSFLEERVAWLEQNALLTASLMQQQSELILVLSDRVLAERATARLERLRQQQPISELQRKADKARRRGYFTQEDLDLASVQAREIARRLQVLTT